MATRESLVSLAGVTVTVADGEGASVICSPFGSRYSAAIYITKFTVCVITGRVWSCTEENPSIIF